MKVDKLEREFSYNGLRLADPNPHLTVEEVRNLYATAYLEITTEAVGNKLIYRLTRAIGTKG